MGMIKYLRQSTCQLTRQYQAFKYQFTDNNIPINKKLLYGNFNLKLSHLEIRIHDIID